MTWREVGDLVEHNNNELKSAQKQVEAERWRYYRSLTGFLPQLSANLSMGQTGPAYGLNATQYLFNGPTNLFTVRTDYLNLEINRANYDITRASIFSQIRQAFIDLYIAQENVKLQAKNLTRRKNNSRLIELRYESGDEDKGNMLRTKANEEQAAYNLSSAEREQRLARLKLSQLLGSEIITVEAGGKIDKYSNQNYSPLLLNSPDYQKAKYELELADATQKGTLSEFLPSVFLSGGLRKSGSTWPPDTDSNSLSLNVSYSIFLGGANIANEVINSLNLERAKEDFANTEKNLRYTLEEAFEQFQDSLEKYAVSQTILNAATERSKIGQEKYMDGLTTYAEWDLIESEYISSQSALLQSQKTVLYAEAAWNKSYGGIVK